jgi:hypothetical protein
VYILCVYHDCLQAAIRAKWDAKNNGSLIDALNEEFGAFSKSVKKVFIAQVWLPYILLLLTQQSICMHVSKFVQTFCLYTTVKYMYVLEVYYRTMYVFAVCVQFMYHRYYKHYRCCCRLPILCAHALLVADLFVHSFSIMLLH